MNGEKKEGLEGGPGGQSEPEPEERLERAFKAITEKVKKECTVIIGRCDALAKKAKRQKDITPSFSFQAKMKTANEIRAARAEYENLKSEAIKRAHEITNRSGDDEFKRVAEAHFRSLDSCFTVEDDFGWKPLKGD
jgi:hypothetical protein